MHPTPARVNARGAVRLVSIGAVTLGWLSLASLHEATLSRASRGPVFQGYMKRWAHSLVRATGGQVSLTPGSVVPDHVGPRLVASNHRSPFDIGILLSIFGGHALSRADLARWPVIGIAAQRAGTIFVDREKAESGASAIRAIRKKLVTGASILVFPEGSTFGGDQVRPFKPGAFTALRGLDAQIVPVGLAYDPGAEWVNEGFVSHVLRVTSRPRTTCVVAIGNPLPVLRNAHETAAAAERVVQELVSEARSAWRQKHDEALGK
jgi:1-acyl-sn-glycerol-3-phosphate acyltransferase